MNLLQLQRGAFVGEGAGEQVPVVRLVEAEGVLHDLGDVPELVAHQAVAVGDCVANVDLLDFEGTIGVEGGPGLGWCCDWFALEPGRTEGARDVFEGVGGHG